MPVTLSPGLQSLVDAAARTKTGYSEALRTGLGNARRLILSKGGTVFLNVGMAGPMAVSSGNITSFGTASGVTVRQAADLLASGGGTLRIEGNGEWYQASIGLTKAAQIAAGVAAENVATYDYYLSANPTATSGCGFAAGAKIKAPRFYPSGTGPSAPPIAATTPTIIELVDWTDQANPVVVGIATFSKRKDDWVYQNPNMAAEIGDVALYTLNDSIKWTTPAANERFELGGLLLIAANYNTENGTQQLEQMLLAFKPYQRWDNYPFMNGQVVFQHDAQGNCTNPNEGDYTYPPPYKINLYTAAGYKNGAADRTPLYTHEIKAFNGKASGPINGPQWSQTMTDDEPCVPHFNCAQMLPWQNMRTRRSSKATRYIAGFTAFSLSGTANDTSSCNPAVPLFNTGGQQNSTNHFYAMPKYPLKNARAQKYGQWDAAYMSAYWPGPADPKLFAPQQVAWHGWMFSGYAWQPGSVSGHDWYTGPGGMRFDRYTIPAVLAHWCTDPNYVRPQGAVPIRDMVEGWGFAYFNHSNHWMRDVVNFEYLPREYALKGHAVFANANYGGGPYGALGQPMGPDKTVDLFSQYAPGCYDAKGRFPYGFWKRDGLHAYTNAGIYATVLNSPMHSIAQMHDFHTLWMSNLGSAGPAPYPGPNANLEEHLFQYRTQGWRWLGYAITWANASEHPDGFSQQELEDRFAQELEALYDAIYKPAFVDNNPSAYFTAIRNLGIAVKASGGNLTSNGGSLGLYMVGALVWLRQTGLWAKMRARNNKCRDALDLYITCYDKMIIEYCADSKMRGAYYPVVVLGKTTTATAADIPTDWAAHDVWLDSVLPPLPASTPEAFDDSPDRYIDFVTRYTGMAHETGGHPYLYYQYMCVRRDYFPENQPAKLGAAISKMEAWFAKYDALVAEGKGYARKMLHPQSGAMLPPSVVGPNIEPV